MRKPKVECLIAGALARVVARAQAGEVSGRPAREAVEPLELAAGGFARPGAVSALCRPRTRAGLRSPLKLRHYLLVPLDLVCKLLFQPARCCFR